LKPQTEFLRFNCVTS